MLFTAADALRFIETTGQQYEFQDYRQDLRTEGPEMVHRLFRDARRGGGVAEEPPQTAPRAAVLIADDYHTVYYWRDTNVRRLDSPPLIEFHLEEMMKDGLPPPPVATFNTREEARAWFYSLPERPSQAVIQLGGEPYLAAYHRNIDHLAFHPFSLVDKLKEWRRKQEQEKGAEEPEPHA